MSLANLTTGVRRTDLACSGVASVALRSLAHAAEILTDRREQEEVLQIFDKINKETGWRIGFVYGDLKAKWGWNEEPSPHQLAQTHTAIQQQRKAQEERERMLQEQAQAAQQMQQGGFNPDFAPQQYNAGMLSQPMQPPPPPVPQAPPQPAPQKRPPAGIPNPVCIARSRTFMLCDTSADVLLT